MAWLWNSMIPEISDTCMFLNSAKEIWDALEQTYSKAKDAAQVYEVKLGFKYWGKQKVPCFNEVVAIVRSEESRRGLMLESPAVENSAMVADHKGDQTLACLVHTREKCWKLYGKALNRDREGGHRGGSSRKGGQVYVAAGTNEENKPEAADHLNQEEIERVENLSYETSQGSEAGPRIGQEKEADQESEINCEADQGDVEAGKFGKSWCTQGRLRPFQDQAMFKNPTRLHKKR
ncbi:hypothetical protein SESBI_19709 [Sesbania bispinosa]|nr:hypothetical protein SESBI_19709 [Sesbania bispinosa]